MDEGMEDLSSRFGMKFERRRPAAEISTATAAAAGGGGGDSGIDARKYTDPYAFVRRVCSRDTTLDGLHNALLEVEDDDRTITATLQSHVYRHHGRYISVAHDVTQLVKEKNQLGELLQQLSDVFHGLSDTLEAGTLPGVGINQEQLYSLSDVAGLDRSASMLAGELVHQGHLVLQEVGSQLVEAPVHVFLMPEALVIAQMEQLSTKLDAQHKLSLLSIEPVTKLRVQDVLDMGEGEHGFCARGRERYYFLAQTGLEKRSWLRLLRRTVQRSGSRASLSRRESIDLYSDQAGAAAGALAADAFLEPWLMDCPDDLDVFIAQRAFDKAVALVDKAQEALGEFLTSPDHEALKADVEQRVERLTEALCHELERPALRRNTIRSTVFMLLRLGKAQQAKEKYLQNWSNSIQRDVKNQKVEGATELYIQKLAQLFFSALASTTQEYDSLFDDTAKSMYVSWVHEEIIKFASAFDQQVLKASTNTYSTVTKCFRIVFDQCHTLREHGLDLEFELWEALGDGLLEAIDEAGNNWINATASQLLDETWEGVTFNGRQARKQFLQRLAAAGVKHPDDYLEGMNSILCDASVHFATHAHMFASASAEICHANTIDMIVHWLKRPFQLIVARMGKAFAGQEHLKTNAVFIIDSILPHTISLIEDRRGAPLPLLHTLAQQVRNTWTKEISEEGISHI